MTTTASRILSFQVYLRTDMHKCRWLFSPASSLSWNGHFLLVTLHKQFFSCLVFAGCWLHYPDPVQASGDGEQTEGVEEVHAARRYQWLQPPMCKTESPMGVFLRCMKYFCMSSVNACMTQTPWGWSVTHSCFHMLAVKQQGGASVDCISTALSAVYCVAYMLMASLYTHHFLKAIFSPWLH